jgi:hypothetical protein
VLALDALGALMVLVIGLLLLMMMMMIRTKKSMINGVRSMTNNQKLPANASRESFARTQIQS